MEWRFHSDAPIYAQLVEEITLRIVTGVYPPGDRLPAVRELAVEAGVNPNTMQRALSELERENLVFSQRTSGRFVTEDREMIEEAKKTIADQRIRTFLKAMDQLGYSREEILRLIVEEEKEEA
ncbi:MAG: GntR family transcriptional regulator [Oscillospiraceae bacterium]|nr:GntR family transcriptional regulator [Oscillospiraceae bacterium]